MSEPKPAALNTQEPETNTPAMVPPATTAFSNLDGYNDDSNNSEWTTGTSESSLIHQQYEQTLCHLVKQVHAAFAASPRPCPNATQDKMTEFTTYWRSTFNKICAKIEADDSFPYYITSPPVSRCEIFLYTQSLSTCDSLPVTPANIILQLEQTDENETGLTKGHLLRAVGRYLYGFDSSSPRLDAKLNITFNGGECQDIAWPTVYSEYELLGRREYPAYLVKKGDRSRSLEEQLSAPDWPSGSGEQTIMMKYVKHDDERGETDDHDAAAEYKFPAVIWDTAWLHESNDWDDEVVYGATPTLYLFCCPPGDFEDRVGGQSHSNNLKMLNWDGYYHSETGSKEEEVKNIF
ncbi:hypothetical protein V8F33_011202 [Rhypophila sp. PSN 637]